MRALFSHQVVKGSLGGRVATMDAVFSQLPGVAGPANRYPGHRIGFIVGLDGHSFVVLLHSQIDLGQAEARDRKIEVKIELFQFQKILAEQPLVPVGMLSQPVVCDPKGLELRLR
ncbi:hypothetical protein [Bradyrhizobium vignae]|uniref:hypothetical protein n=1 Tax=Bradyrhizobium vignae TaxID=1549949 RepID=UPI001FCF082E|nr:hypothetical protein [Bradyrhizobium vignae]